MGQKRKRSARRAFGENAKYLLLISVAAAAVFLVVLSLNRPAAVTADPTARSPQPTTTAESAQPVAVAIIGDSFTACSGMGGCNEANYIVDLAAQLGWTFTSHAVGGTGYLNKEGGKTTFGERVDAVIASKPAVVVVQGGGNDVSFLEGLPAAAIDTLSRLRAGLPEAKIVVVGPVATVASDERWTEARDAIQSAATTAGVDLFIDPIAERWFMDDNEALIGTDGVHPTDEGHDYIAALLLEPLRGVRS